MDPATETPVTRDLEVAASEHFLMRHGFSAEALPENVEQRVAQFDKAASPEKRARPTDWPAGTQELINTLAWNDVHKTATLIHMFWTKPAAEKKVRTEDATGDSAPTANEDAEEQLREWRAQHKREMENIRKFCAFNGIVIPNDNATPDDKPAAAGAQENEESGYVYVAPVFDVATDVSLHDLEELWMDILWAHEDACINADEVEAADVDDTEVEDSVVQDITEDLKEYAERNEHFRVFTFEDSLSLEDASKYLPCVAAFFECAGLGSSSCVVEVMEMDRLKMLAIANQKDELKDEMESHKELKSKAEETAHFEKKRVVLAVW